MNIERIFDSLNKDDMNSSLGIICSELELQGYKVRINSIDVSSDEFFDNRLENLEQIANAFNIALYKNENLEQEFSLHFTDYHQIVFMPKDKDLDIDLKTRGGELNN